MGHRTGAVTTTLGRRNRRNLLTALAAAPCLTAPSGLSAQQIRFFRIATAGITGTYHPIAQLIAESISAPPGARACGEGVDPKCGVPNLVAIAQTSSGSVANAIAVHDNTVESGFVQGDIAFWAYHGQGVFEDRAPMRDLRLITGLYPESLHLVARKGSGIAHVSDLPGKRVSLDEDGSGTLVDARLLLAAYGIEEAALETVYLKPSSAIDLLLADELDAFVTIAGTPTASVVELARAGAIDLVPIDGPAAERLIERLPFFDQHTIPADVYPGIPATPTIGVSAQWLTNRAIADDLIYSIVTALWHPVTAARLTRGHAQGRFIALGSALRHDTVPLHAGALRYYREMSVLPSADERPGPHDEADPISQAG